MKWTVIIERTTVERAAIEIEAATEQAAKTLAEIEAENEFPEYGEMQSCDYEAKSTSPP